MVISCAAFGCEERFKLKKDLAVGEKNLSFHRFPLDNNQLLLKWTEAMRREKWNPTKYERICEKHFLPSDYHYHPPIVPELTYKKNLKKDAIPSVFKFPKLLNKTTRRFVRRKQLMPKKSAQKDAVPSDFELPKHSKMATRDYVKRKQTMPTTSAHSDAVPSVFAFSQHLKASCSLKRRQSIPIASVEKAAKSDVSQICAHHDHTYQSKTSRTKLWIKRRKKNSQKNRKLRNLKKMKIRLEKNVSGLVSQLKEVKLLDNKLAVALKENFGHMATEIIKNEAKNIGISAGSRHANEIKEFALTLHFCSPKAYKFVRKALHLPHSATLRSWCANDDCEPGFLEQSLEYVGTKVALGQQDCVILLDEMRIKKQIQWDKKRNKFIGQVDYSGIQVEMVDTEASNTLVLMASGLQKPWFVPVGYFLTNELNASILKEIIFEAIRKLTEKGAEVHAIIFDGAPGSLEIAAKLGCKIKDLDGSFNHPAKPGQKMYCILDICHLIKLARNALADMQNFYTASGVNIAWKFVLELYNTQEKDILSLGNKFKTKHALWQNHKRKVRVAGQTLSHSVAAAITFLRDIKVPGFEGSQSTSGFISLVDDLFNVLNSKSKFGKNCQNPITLYNFLEIEKKVRTSIDFLKVLEDKNGLPLKDGQRKTFVVGIYISSLSILKVVKNLLCRKVRPFKYMLTYRFSQDQLAMYFAKIRSSIGSNNDPTILQFKYSIRQSLLKAKIECPSSANSIDISNIEEPQVTKADPQVSELLRSTPIWHSDAIHYISEYIVKRLLESITCTECATSLYRSDSSGDNSYQGNLTLLSCKGFGNLIVPSSSVCKVVDCVDKKARRALCKWTWVSKEFLIAVQSDVISDMRNCTFQTISDHSKETHILDFNFRDDHITYIIRGIVKQYFVLFYHQFWHSRYEDNLEKKCCI